MTIFTQKMLQEYIAPLNRLIDLQAGIIAKKEEEILVLKTENHIIRAESTQIQLEINRLKETQNNQDPELEPLSTRQEPWTLRKQRLEREDRQSPEAVAQRMQLEQYWKKRNEGINAIERSNT